MWGLGPGQGNPGIIPEASTDFIFATIGEEIGLVGVTALLIAYLLMVGLGAQGGGALPAVVHQARWRRAFLCSWPSRSSW